MLRSQFRYGITRVAGEPIYGKMHGSRGGRSWIGVNFKLCLGGTMSILIFL